MVVTPVLISGDVVTEVEEPKSKHAQRLDSASLPSNVGPSESLSELENAEDEDDFYLDEFERSWAERWLNGVIIRGEGWLAEVEPEEDEEPEDSASPAETEDDADLGLWEEYYAREQVLQDASELLSLMVCCTGKRPALLSDVHALTHFFRCGRHHAGTYIPCSRIFRETTCRISDLSKSPSTQYADIARTHHTQIT